MTAGGAVMAKKVIPNEVPCGACGGKGGAWEVTNGNKFGKRVWRTCVACNGKGTK